MLTHRNLRRDYPINSTGHADLIQLSNGEWWAVLLASRPWAATIAISEEKPLPFLSFGRMNGPFSARIPAMWSLPIRRRHCPFAAGKKRLRATHLKAVRWICAGTFSARPAARFTALRSVRLAKALPFPFPPADLENPAFIGRRQQHLSFAARLMMAFVPAEGEAAGWQC